jgi:hypothetical protein
MENITKFSFIESYAYAYANTLWITGNVTLQDKYQLNWKRKL